MTTTTKKITRATIKSFVNKNRENLYIKNKSTFDGMVDCVMPLEGGFFKAETNEYSNNQSQYTLGIKGVWLVGSSRDSFRTYEDDNFIGYDVYNCCGSFIIGIKK